MGSLVSNLEFIKPILNFEDGWFYYARIVQRRKDIPELPVTSRILRYEVIPSMEYLESHMSFWWEFCDVNRARMYIETNRKRFDLTSYKMTELISKAQGCNDLGHIQNIFSKAALRTPTDKDNKWILIDIDEPYDMLTGRVRMWLHSCGHESYVVPTKNGHHVITKRFNQEKFKEEFYNKGYEIEIKKDVPTLLIY